VLADAAQPPTTFAATTGVEAPRAQAQAPVFGRRTRPAA
jgi:hypothetical protein